MARIAENVGLNARMSNIGNRRHTETPWAAVMLGLHCRSDHLCSGSVTHMTDIMRMTKSVAASRDWGTLDHYLIAAYASTEPHLQRTVVIDPTLTTPAWLLKPRARSLRRNNILALLLPTLEMLTLELAQTHTRMGTDYIGVREWSAADRAAGRTYAHLCPEIAAKITTSGLILTSRPGTRPASDTAPA